MYRYSVAVALLMIFLFTGCSVNSPKPNENLTKAYKNENKYILYALSYQQQQKYKEAIKYYIKLYNHTKKFEYLKEIISLSASLKDYSLLGKYVKIGLERFHNNQFLKKAQIQYYLFKKDYKKVEDLTLKLTETYKNEESYEFAGYAFLNMKKYSLALKFFERAYGINFNEDILCNISDILYTYLNRKDDAIAYLETHIRLKGCSRKVCFKLLGIYAREKDINGLISVYKRLYKHKKRGIYAKKLVDLLLYQGEKEEAISFLKKSGYDEDMLMDIYLSSKNFKEAYKVAKNLYLKTNDVKYLGKMAIYQYESAKIKDKKLISSVVKKFEKTVKKSKDPMFLNYYGYLLIDYDIDIKKGIKLVKEALRVEPDSPYYLDSLAWGYYKLGKCKKAKKIMQKVTQMSQDKEVLKHMKMIEKCIKEEK